jgi:undecaprenyl diphosphate synthase
MSTTTHFAAQRPSTGIHVAIIMDGNGRWAAARGMPRSAGHAAGAAAVEPVVRAAPKLGIGVLTLFALSSDNWTRPPAEVEAILELLREYLDAHVVDLERDGVRLSVIGRRDRLPTAVLESIERAEERSRAGTSLHLRLAIDYSSRDEIVRAARHFHVQFALDGARDGFARVLTLANDGSEVDLLVRSGGEQRLSDFLLWESAYAELVFTPVLWPDFDVPQLERAVQEFKSRRRRFGGLSERDVG